MQDTDQHTGKKLSWQTEQKVRQYLEQKPRQQSEQHIYIAIDLKSFYASVECQERGLDPITTNLVVADSSRTEKTICLAVSPSLKKYGIQGGQDFLKLCKRLEKLILREKEGLQTTHLLEVRMMILH